MRHEGVWAPGRRAIEWPYKGLIRNRGRKIKYRWRLCAVGATVLEEVLV
jgi:hypothetical protein